MRDPLRPVPLLLAASLSLLSACGGLHRVRVPLLRPAAVNLSAYQTLAVTELAGDRSHEVAGLIEEKMLEAGRFQIVDRAHMNQVMNEQRLSASDLAQGSNAVKLGELVTAGALISGSVDARYREIPRSRRWKDAKGVDHTENWLEGEATLRASLKVIDVSTGKILLARNFDTKKESAGGAAANVAGLAASIFAAAVDVSARHDPPDRERLEREAREHVVTDFVRAVAPRKEMTEIGFAVDGKLPQLESGIGWAQRGEWKKAQDSFNDAIRAAENDPRIDSKTLAKAYLDFGLSHALAGDYDAGIKALSKAYDLAADPYYLDQVDFAKRLQDDAKKVGEQTAAPAQN